MDQQTDLFVQSEHVRCCANNHDGPASITISDGRIKAAKEHDPAEQAKREAAEELLSAAESEIERREWLIEYVKADGDDPDSEAMQGFIEAHAEDPKAYAYLRAHLDKVTAPGYVSNTIGRRWSTERVERKIDIRSIESSVINQNVTHDEKERSETGGTATESDPEAAPQTFVWLNQTDAANFVGCTAETMSGWIQDGLITTYGENGQNFQFSLVAGS